MFFYHILERDVFDDSFQNCLLAGVRAWKCLVVWHGPALWISGYLHSILLLLCLTICSRKKRSHRYWASILAGTHALSLRVSEKGNAHCFNFPIPSLDFPIGAVTPRWRCLEERERTERTKRHTAEERGSLYFPQTASIKKAKHTKPRKLSAIVRKFLYFSRKQHPQRRFTEHRARCETQKSTGAAPGDTRKNTQQQQSRH